VTGRTTTRCCSAGALILSSCAFLFGQTPSPFPAPSTSPASPTKASQSGPPSLFPVGAVWTLALNTQLTAKPAYDGARAYFSIADDRIVAYNLVDGAQQWLVSAKAVRQPAAGDDLLFVPEEGSLVARSESDGSVRWQAPLDHALTATPAWQKGHLVLATAAGIVRSLDTADGRERWSRSLGTVVAAPAAFGGGRVYLSTADGRIVALDAASGEPVWERRLGGVPSEILALDDRVYAGSHDNYFYCLMTKDGAIDWRWRTGGDIVGAPVHDDRRVYFVSLDNVLRALDRKSGVQQWMRALPIRPTAGPAKAGGNLVVAGLSPTLRAFNTSDGAPAGEINAPADIAAPPYVFTDASGIPRLLFVAADIAKGATATLAVRRWEPETAPVAPLPNLITLTPTLRTP